MAASAGMIAPGAEIWEARARPHPREGAFAALARHSAGLWPQWAQRLLAETGIDPAYRPCGALLPAREPDMVEALATLGVEAEALDQDGARRHMPGLAMPEGAVFLPGDAQVSAPLLGRALITALGQRGVDMREGARVTGLERAGGFWQVHLASGGTIAADYAVLAAGWAAADLHAAASGVYPVKGQALMLDAGRDVASWPLLRAGDVYMAAKPGGRLLIGASAEPGRSDRDTDRATAGALLERAARYLPAVLDMTEQAHWAGVRPALPDMMPRAGLAEPGLVVALGAYRHGIMLAPAIAEGLARLIDEGVTEASLAPFAPGTVNEGLSSGG